MSSSDTPARKPLTSRAWRYFHIKDKKLKLASCKICQNVLSYRTSVTNLLKHVRKRHKKALGPVREDNSDKSENGEVSIFSLSDNEDDFNDDDSEDSKAVKILDSLENKNEEESVCLLCQETFPDQDSSEMMHHMVKVHNISQIKIVNGNVHLEQEESKPIENSKKKRSCCWDYFTISDRRSKMAVCNLCDRHLSFKTTVSNLIKHLRRKHHIVPKAGQDQYVTNSGEKIIYKPRSAVWSFFNYVNDEKTVCACVRCNTEFNIVDGLEQMKRHLVEKHPEDLLHHKTEGDPLFITTANTGKNEMSEDDNVAEEYLDLDELDMPGTVTPKLSYKRRYDFEPRSSFEERPSFERRSSFEQKLNFDRKSKRPLIYRSPVFAQNKVPDSLEHFSNYVTSLLQELPDKISKTLQMNFIKQIIEAQIEMGNTKETGIKISSTVGGTVSNDDVTVPEVSVPTSEKITTTLANTDNSDGIVTISNGIITIRPTVTTP